MYGDPSFELIGSPPPSSSRAPSSCGNAFVYTDRAYQYGDGRSSAYERELFGGDTGRDSVLSSRPPSGRQSNGYSTFSKASKPPHTPKTPINNRTQTIRPQSRGSTGKKKKQYKSQPSYTDDLLFGNTTPKPEDSLWESSTYNQRRAPSPASSDRSYQPKNYYTRNLNKSNRDIPPSRTETPTALHTNGRSSRQDITPRSEAATPTPSQMTRSSSASRSPKKKNRNKHNPSYVDEMLFGPKLEEASFKAPWDESVTPRPHRFDYSDYKGKSEGPNASRPPSARPSSRQSSASRPGSRAATSNGRSSALNGSVTPTQKKLFKDSYVDENLFGPKPVECDWDAPWENPRDKYRKPLIYDSSDYKIQVQHENIPKPRPHVKASLHKSKSASTSELNKRPAWR